MLSIVYYIIGPTASGKTTSAQRLSAGLKIPCFHADLVYNKLKDKYKLTCEPAKLTDYQLWNDPRNFGIETWGAHATMFEAKRECYVEMLSGYAANSFIIEGFTLSFPEERILVENAIGAHVAVIVRINLPFSRWQEFFQNKFHKDASIYKGEHARLTSCFTPRENDLVLVYDDPGKVDANNILSDLIYMGFCKKTREVGLSEQNLMKNFFVTRNDFEASAKRTMSTVPKEKNSGYWSDFSERWNYHMRAIELMEMFGVTSPDKVLELGTMGCPIVNGSRNMDYDKNLEHYNSKPDIIHDARCIPWPIEDGAYEWFVSLRVYHHLWPVQRECFEEARRIARKVLLVVPTLLPTQHNMGAATAITPEDFRSWNSGVRPDLCEPTGSLGPNNISFIYLWTK